MARTSNGVRFVLKNPKQETSPVKAIFCYGGSQMYYYERKLSIPTKYWNKSSQRGKETKAFLEYPEFNHTLDTIASTILSCYRTFKNNNRRDPSIVELRDMVKNERGANISITKPVELLEFIEQFIDDAKSGKHINQARGTQIAKVTIRTYEQTLRLLKSYSQFKKLKINYDDINSQFHREFNHYLSKVYKSEETGAGLKINTIGKHFTNIKTFMSAAFERKLTTNEGYKLKAFKVIRENVENIALSAGEIIELEKLDLSNESTLEKVRDLFLIGCETGLRISDLKRLKKEHIQEYDNELYIEIEMQKTGRRVTIPLSERALWIMNKYERVTGEYFPKAISDQKANDYIKKIASKVPCLCKDVVINSTENGFRVEKNIPKYELITHHTARRSFATNWVLKGLPYSSIMKITGHKTDKSFTRYIKINELEGAKLFSIEMKKVKQLERF